ncbi:NAD(P)H-binding protein [Desertivirga brevis]|uniref:NAD(P)H-binding protein n=1 Tax=Desertivirga brevis TaxID=2810310 RepID=UPI001A97C4F1|nr:NAD(P)H-binding protein [Pedobacter sp. SYSU D00873]
MKKAVIAGATGLIGSSLLQLLLINNSFDEVLALSRSPLSFTHPKLKQLIINFNELEQHKDEIRGDVVYYCLGTTKSATPSTEMYRKIEHEYLMKLSLIAKDNNISQFHYISALGASATSPFFYSKLKWETEEDLKKIGVKSLHIYQPSLLTGKRKEPRVVENLFIKLMSVVNPLLIDNFKKYRSIEATTVAKAMLNQTLKEIEGIHIYPSDKIKELA